MSQQQFFNTSSTPGVPNVEFLQGNDNVPVGPNPATHVIDVIGDTTKGVSVTNTDPYTEQVSVAFSTYSTPGVSSYNVTNFTVAAGVVSSNNIDIIAGTGLSGGGNVTLGGSVTLNATGPTTDLHVARYIVSAGGTSDGANYTTIASAYAAAIAAGAPQTVFIQPGIYTENITLSAGINIAAFECDAMTPNVTILGTLTATYSGNCSISGINFETNSDNILVMSGSNATELSILNCYFTISNATAFNLTNSNSNSLLNLAFCHGDISSTGITLYSSSFAGSIQEDWCKFTNSGNSTTASTFSAGGFQTRSGYYNNVFEFTGSAGCDFNNSVVYTYVINSTPIIVNSTSGDGNNLFFTRLDSGSAVCFTIGAGATATLINCCIYSLNGSTAISGSGTINYTPISFFGTQNSVTVSTQTPLTIGPNIFPVDSGTAGQVWTSNGAGMPPTFQDNAGGPEYTNVTFAMSPYTVTATDYYLSVDSSDGSVTINLPDTTTNGRQFVIKDRLGQSQTNNIIIKSLSGMITVDQQSSYTFVDNFESLECLFHTSNYEVF